MLPVKSGDLPLPGRSWKQLVEAAEAQLIDPAFALQRAPEQYVLRAFVPGGRELDVNVRGQTLTVSGFTRQRFIARGTRTFGYIRERPVRADFTLPPDAAESGITTVVNHDSLVVTIPRLPCVNVECADAGTKLPGT